MLVPVEPVPAVLRFARWLRLLLVGCFMALLGACSSAAPAGSPVPRIAEYAGRQVGRVDFAGENLLPRDSLDAVTLTRPSRCELPLLRPPLCLLGTDRFRLEPVDLVRDAARLQLYYRDHGYYGTRVVPEVRPLGSRKVAVRFVITPGDRVVLRELAVEGTEGIVPAADVLRELPLEPGRAFRRGLFLASADTVRAELYRRGYAYADVLRNYSIDTIADVADAQFIAIPGPLVRVDTVVIVGADRLGREVVLRQLTFRQGEVLQTAELNRSQRNLYSLNLVNFATVGLAPDSLQVDTVASRATVLVRVVEAAEYVVDASVGYGTADCLRSGVRWTDRNFRGGARRLELSGSVSSVGVGKPTDLALDETVLCSALQGNGRGAVFDGIDYNEFIEYRAAAEIEQPTLFTAAERLTARLQAERISEVDAFVRELVGGQVAVSRDIGLRTRLTTTLEVENGRTQADAAVFCVTFEVCRPETRRQLQERRWSNTLGLAATYDRSEATREFGYVLTASTLWASSALASDDEYLRLNAQATALRSLRPGWVLAGTVQAGTFLQGTFAPGSRFVPPERRFYAGGSNSVRGFPRNALGPQAYVADSVVIRTEDGVTDTTFTFLGGSPRIAAAGGTQMVVGSLELRTPSPILPAFTRLAAFVDVGQVSAPGRATFEPAPLYLTPGAGVRFITPVGPIRVDVGYNPYGRGTGPLYLVDAEDGERFLRLAQSDYRPELRSFWDRLEFHLAVGQAF